MKNKHPKLYKLIKKTNRGLALGLVIIIVMTVWLSVSASRVKKDEAAIRALTREYLTELIEISALMNGDDAGEKIPEATQKKMSEAIEDLVDKYYSDSKDARNACKNNSRRKSGAQLLDEFSQWAKTADVVRVQSVEIVEREEVLDSGAVLYNYSFDPVLKAGKYLEVWFSFEADVVYDTTSPYEFRIYPFFTNNGYYEEYEYYDDKYVGGGYVDGEFEKGEAYRVDATINVTGRIVLVREGDEWKVACTQEIRTYTGSKLKMEPLTKEVE